MADQHGARRAEPAARRLADDTAELVHAELTRLRDDVADIARRSSVGILLTAAAGFSGALAAHAAATTMLRTADRVLPPRAAAGTLTVLYLTAAAGLGILGAVRLREAQQVARRAGRDLRADADAANPTGGEYD